MKQGELREELNTIFETFVKEEDLEELDIAQSEQVQVNELKLNQSDNGYTIP